MKKFFKTLLLLFVLLAAAATVWLLYAAHRYRAIVTMGKQAQASYEALSRDYKFDATRPTTDTTARWNEFLTVRARAIAAIPKNFDARAPKILAMKKPGLGGEIKFLLDLAPELDPVVKAHTAALRQAKMGPLEYRHMLGVAMLGAVREPEKYPAGKAYRRLAEQIMAFGRRFAENARLDVRPDEIPNAAAAMQTLEQEFGSYPAAPPEVLEKLTAKETGYLADIFAVAVDPEEMAGQ